MSTTSDSDNDSDTGKSVIVPLESKYVPGGYKAKTITHTDETIQKYMEEMDENTDYIRYDGPIHITSIDGDVIPIPSENKGRYAFDWQDGEKQELGPAGLKPKTETTAGSALVAPKSKVKEIFNISAKNEDGIIRKGAHIRYIRKDPMKFVKGGFIRHINSTYIAFGFARGSSTVQIDDILHLYYKPVIGRKKGFKMNSKPKSEPIKVVIKESSFQDQTDQQLQKIKIKPKLKSPIPISVHEPKPISESVSDPENDSETESDTSIVKPLTPVSPTISQFGGADSIVSFKVNSVDNDVLIDCYEKDIIDPSSFKLDEQESVPDSESEPDIQFNPYAPPGKSQMTGKLDPIADFDNELIQLNPYNPRIDAKTSISVNPSAETKPKNKHKLSAAKKSKLASVKLDPDMIRPDPHNPGKFEYVDTLTGKKFRDATHLKQYISTQKYQKMKFDMTLPFDPKKCCSQCNRRFRDNSALLRHKSTKKYKNGNCF